MCASARPIGTPGFRRVVMLVFCYETYVNCVSPILAKTYGVSPQTIYEAINRYRAVRLQASWGSWDFALSAGHAHMARYSRDAIRPVNDEIMPLWFAGDRIADSRVEEIVPLRSAQRGAQISCVFVP